MRCELRRRERRRRGRGGWGSGRGRSCEDRVDFTESRVLFSVYSCSSSKMNHDLLSHARGTSIPSQPQVSRSDHLVDMSANHVAVQIMWRRSRPAPQLISTIDVQSNVNHWTRGGLLNKESTAKRNKRQRNPRIMPERTMQSATNRCLEVVEQTFSLRHLLPAFFPCLTRRAVDRLACPYVIRSLFPAGSG